MAVISNLLVYIYYVNFIYSSYHSNRPSIIYTAWLKKMGSISYVYISWTIHGMWMIYTSFERWGPTFSNTTARALAERTAVQQRQLRAKWLLCSTRFFAFVCSLKLSLNWRCCTAVH